MKQLNLCSLITRLLLVSQSCKFAVISHLTETDPETLLYLRCSFLGLCLACGFDPATDKQLQGE